jgi:hypothetical protein
MGNSASLSLTDSKCQICNKILHKPILISCKCQSSICQEHLNELFSNNAKEALFECKKCKTKLNLIKTDLKENTQLNLDLERLNYLSNKTKKLKWQLKAKLDEIEKCVQNVKEVKLDEYSEKIYDHFYLLRNEIDIKRETLLEQIYQEDGEPNKNDIDQINRQSSNLIENIDLTKIEFRKKFMQEISAIINEINLDEKRKILFKMLRNTTLDEKDMEKLLNEYETKMKQMHREFTQIERKLSVRLKANKFIEFNQETAQFLGEIRLNDFVKKYDGYKR